MTAAARQWDPIEHSSAMSGLLAGLAIGATAALIGLAIVGTGGLAAVAIVGASAVAGAGIGELLGSLSFAMHAAGNIASGSPNVHINGIPAARAHVDTAKCDKHGPAPQIVAQGSSTVHINGQPAARVGDRTVCDGKISAGSSNVFIGGGTDTTDTISPEVPEYVHRALLIAGFVTGSILASPVVAGAAIAVGLLGGFAGSMLGGRLFGEGSDGQKLTAFGGAVLAGGLGAKGGRWFDSRYEIQAKGLGSNFGNVGIKPREPVVAEPLRDAKGRFVPASDTPRVYNRKSQYPSDYRSGIKDQVLDANTIKEGPHAGKILTADGDKVFRTNPRITIEHNKAVVEHWNDQGYNSGRAARNDFYNDVDNMSIRLRGPNSSDGAKMGNSGIRYRQDTGPDYTR